MKGFSTLEMMIAFAIMSVVLGGVAIADFSAQYWMVNAQTSNEALYKAKTTLEDLRATAKANFYYATSSPASRVLDSSCSSGGLCYYVETLVTDLSPCSKYAQAVVSWRVERYPTTTTSLATNLTYPAEGLNDGGDCPLNQPSGSWSSPASAYTADFGGTPTGLDVLDGNAYVAVGSAPYLEIVGTSGDVLNAGCTNCSGVYNALDVAHDSTTGRTYVYAARNATTSQLEVIDVTDASSPSMLAQATFASVDPYGSYPQGWRVYYYGRKVYIVARETAGPELHVFDVGNPDAPVEVGSMELGTSVYGLVVRDQYVGTTLHRFAYLATTRNPYELMVLDVTDPANISEVTGARVDFPGSQTAKALYLNGTTLYVGRDSVPGGDELYALDARNPTAASGGLPILQSADVGSGITAIRVSGAYIFLATTGSQLLIRNTADLSSVGGFSLPGLTDTALDLNGDYIYAASGSSPRLRVLKSN